MLTRQRCFHHASREAVARCPECGNTFCRECVTEHDGRVICAVCLGRLAETRHEPRRRLAELLRPAQVVAGLLLLWLLFFAAGRALVAIPSPFHEGTLWQELLEKPQR